MQIYISHTREAKLRSYAKAQGKTLSGLIGDYIDHLNYKFIPVEKLENPAPVEPSVKCSLPFCKSMAVGHFTVSAPDPIEGSIVKDQYLCKLHKALAQREGEITEI